MIKNEEKILERCLESVENLVDYFCITDTGSTDNSVKIAEDFLKTHKGRIFSDEWKNFGHNRSLSFINAKEYLKELNCNLDCTYGLLLDADMVFIPGTLREQTLTSVGYKIVQENGSLEYYNTRLVRMDYAWKCTGVTHEYWDGPSETVAKHICYIVDRNDGGSKSDKFQRDERLLVQGIQDEPTNVRYAFYLAQTYNCLRKWKEAIIAYKRRIDMGGWSDEVWYSMYMIGMCYKSLEDVHNFEFWMQEAYDARKWRAEPLYELTKYFRETSKHHKAYHYCVIGSSIKFPENDVLFVEKFPHNGGFLYEKSILDYYVHDNKTVGLRDSFNYLLKNGENMHNVVSNLKFYTKSIASSTQKLDFSNPFGDEFRPSAISILNYPYANSRFVNYKIQTDGGYHTPEGIIITKNAYVNLETGEATAMQDSEPLFECQIRGIEDLRVYVENGKTLFTSTSYKQYIKDAISIVHGEYDIQTHTLKDCIGIHSPTGNKCEKNWVHVPDTSDMIYSWRPLRIGKIDKDRLVITKTINTPPLFDLFRGSSPPLSFENQWMVLVHFVEYSIPRKYYHCFVRLTKEYTPIAVSLPFYFRENAIEYCISVIKQGDNLKCFASLNDCDPHEITIPYSSLEWMNVV